MTGAQRRLRAEPDLVGHRVGPLAAWPAGKLAGPGYEHTTRGSERWRRRVAAAQGTETGVHGDRLTTTRVLLPRISCSSLAMSQERLRAASDEPNVELLPATRQNRSACAHYTWANKQRLRGVLILGLYEAHYVLQTKESPAFEIGSHFTENGKPTRKIVTGIWK